MKPKLFASFSGGKTSAFMTKMLLDNKADDYEIVVLFSNTGEEDRRTLDFVHNCDRHFGFNTVWIEAVVHHEKRRSCTHKVVSYETAARNGEPFEEVIKKYGIPNMSFPHCTRELKMNPMHDYIASLGWKEYLTAIGIRADERRRVSANAESQNLIYPLIDIWPTDKQDVNDWWDDQPFNLDLQEHEGNCKWCWKKSFSKHMRLIAERPEVYDFPRKMEAKYGQVGPNPAGGSRVFFRNNTSTERLFKYEARGLLPTASDPKQIGLDLNGGCSESCELYPMTEAA